MNAFANPGGVPSLDKLPSVIDTLIKAGRARYAGVLIGAGSRRRSAR